MNRSRHAHCLRYCLRPCSPFSVILASLLVPWIPIGSLSAQEPVVEQKTKTILPSASDVEVISERGLGEDQVRFSFSGVPWRDVISWIAEEADLALHVDGVPSGSFTYSDPDSFTHQGAIDRINLFLLPQGYTLVRSGNLLSVINLTDPRSLEQLDALADLIKIDSLESRKNHDVVKCLFPLGALSAEDAVEELSAIKLMMTPAVFSKTNQLMITDTVAKLRNVKAILDSFEPSTLDNGTVIKTFPLKHVDAEDILVVARPHLGLATGEMIGIDVSLSADLQGKYIFVTGIEDKVKLIERLVESIDVAEPTLTDADSDAKLQTHEVAGGNVDLAYDVLQTLLVGKQVRISKDEMAGTIVALASEKIQEEIAMTVAKLAANEAEFEVIQLRAVDPYVAIGLIEQMLDLPSPYDDEDEFDIAPPKIDADPENRRLFVRGRRSQIDEIKQIVAGLDAKPESFASNERIRLLSLKGNHAKQTLFLAARFWRLPNPIVFFESDESLSGARRERVVHEQTDEQSVQGNDFLDALQSKAPNQFVSLSNRGRLLQTPAADATKPAIECQLTTRGLLLQCEDIDALNQFQDHLEMLAGAGGSAPAEPIVFYLKFTRPDEAIRMLAELLDGGEAATSNSDTLVNASVSSSSGSMFGSLVTNREGTITLIAGTATVVADSRLNRLIVQGTSNDIDLIESYLRIIEKDSSITTIATYGTSHVIELVNTKATEVEAAIRQAFAGRIAAPTGIPGAAGGSNATRADTARNGGDSEKSKGQKESKKQPPKPASQKARDMEPKMTLAVHQPSNSLIVTAPEQLFKEVEALARTIDERNEQIIQVITPTNSRILETVLQEMLLGQSSRRSSPTSSRSSSRSSSRPSSSSATTSRVRGK